MSLDDLIRECKADILRHTVSRCIPMRNICTSRMELGTYVRHELDSLVLAFSSEFLGKKVSSEIVERKTGTFPATTWQAVRLNLLPRFWLKWFPVKTRDVTVAEIHNHYHVCPHIDVPKGSGVHFKFLLNDCVENGAPH